MRRYGSEANERWVGFEHRPGDIVISTRSKCGTTWLQMISALLVFQAPDLPGPLAELSPWLDWEVEPIEVVRARLAAQRHRRFIKTHTPLDGLPLQPDVTYIVVGRHPCDVAESLYHHGHNIDRDRFETLTGRRTSPPEGPFADWIDGWLVPAAGPEEQLDTMPGLLHHLADAWARSGAPNIILVHYRDLNADLEGQMRRFADRLRIAVPAERWPKLVEAASFDSMRARADRLAPDRLGVLKDRRSFFRSGPTGPTKRLCQADDIRRCETRVLELASAGLAHWLLD